MSTYIALLRGINVSGQKKIQMAYLRKLFETLGLKDVQSYIQSGNVVFDIEDNISVSDLHQNIENAIQNQYGFFVPVLITTPGSIEQILTRNPYKKEAILEPNRVLITLLQDTPDPTLLASLCNLEYPPDRFEYNENSVFIHCPNGSGKSKLSNNFLETKLKVKATSRNYQTLKKILELTTRN